MADSDKQDDEPSLEERHEEMRKRLEEMRKNPKTWFEFRLILNVPMDVQGQKTYCASNARMAVNLEGELDKAIQQMSPILHEVALTGKQIDELKALSKKVAAELREQFVKHEGVLETVVRKLIVEYMQHQWQYREQDQEGVS
jgi:hypothetical protein